MPRPRAYKTEAIVLKHQPLGEADRLLTILTPSYGKLRVVAKGARRPKSKVAGHVEPLTRSALLLSQGQNLDVVSQAQAIESYPRLRSDLWLASCAMYLAELTDAFATEATEHYAVYQLLQTTLDWLEQGGPVGLVLRHYEVTLLGLVGYRPELHHCVECRRPIEPGQHVFSAPAGGIVCPACRGSVRQVRLLSLNALKVLRLLERGDRAAMERLRLSNELEGEVEQTLRQYVWYHLEREMKSAAFLDLLRREAHALS